MSRATKHCSVPYLARQPLSVSWWAHSSGTERVGFMGLILLAVGTWL